MSAPVFSILIPTFNSEQTLELCLQSIRGQNYPQSLVEVLVIDGGSTDKTLAIARQYGAKILSNTDVQPSAGKRLGLLNAQGQFLVFLDSDELFDTKMALQTRILAINAHGDTWLWIGAGYTRPEKAHWINDYINIFSDPFSYFMYGIPAIKGAYLPAMKKHYKVLAEDKQYTVLQIDKSRESPLVDFSAGLTLHRKKVFSLFESHFSRKDIIPTLSYLVMHETGILGLLNEQGVLHYGTSSVARYLNKLRWRVIMNIYQIREYGPGHISTEPFHPALFRWKKYFFLPYALFIPLPLARGIFEALRHRSPILLLHPFFCVYTAWTIAATLLRKSLGIKVRVAGYGEKQGT